MAFYPIKSRIRAWFVALASGRGLAERSKAVTKPTKPFIPKTSFVDDLGRTFAQGDRVRGNHRAGHYVNATGVVVGLNAPDHLLKVLFKGNTVAFWVRSMMMDQETNDGPQFDISIADAFSLGGTD